MELDRKSLQTPEINLLNITNDENQKENRAADQFFSSLLVLLCYKKGAPQKGQPESCRSSTWQWFAEE